jgi:hypothetical protein
MPRKSPLTPSEVEGSTSDASGPKSIEEKRGWTIPNAVASKTTMNKRTNRARRDIKKPKEKIEYKF